MRYRCLAFIAIALLTAPARGGYAIDVELENLSGQDKSNWPVIVNVWQVLGRNLPPGTIDPRGFHVIGPEGKELAWRIEKIPPYDVPGNDELIFIVPSMKAGEKITVRISNDDRPSAARGRIDVVGSSHNLITNGGFEAGDGGEVQGWSGHCRLDGQVKRSGGSSLLVAGDSGRRAAHAARIPPVSYTHLTLPTN